MNIPIETLRNDLHSLPPKWAESGKGKDSMDGYQELANTIVAQAGTLMPSYSQKGESRPPLSLICKDQFIISLFTDSKPILFSANKFHTCFFHYSP